MRRYAQETAVSVEKSKAEIETMLNRYGATAFMSGTNQTEAVIAFEMVERKIMFRLPLPARNERRFTHTRARRLARSPEEAHREWEQACRSRWRALALAIKAKLEAVSIGITTFEDEFMAHIVMPDGLTVSQHVRPRIAADDHEAQAQAIGMAAAMTDRSVAIVPRGSTTATVPELEDLRGSAPDATGDLSSEAFVRKTRDDWT